MGRALVPIAFRLNGEAVVVNAPPGEFLATLLRDRLGLHGTKVSCAAEVCGACTVLVDGLPVSSCCYLAADLEDREVLTIEGARDHPAFARIEAAFLEHFAVQCGFCTPGFVMTLIHLSEKEQPEELDIAKELSGNLCRCTGYKSIVEAAVDVLVRGERTP